MVGAWLATIKHWSTYVFARSFPAIVRHGAATASKAKQTAQTVSRGSRTASAHVKRTFGGPPVVHQPFDFGLIGINQFPGVICSASMPDDRIGSPHASNALSRTVWDEPPDQGTDIRSCDVSPQRAMQPCWRRSGIRCHGSSSGRAQPKYLWYGRPGSRSPPLSSPLVTL